VQCLRAVGQNTRPEELGVDGLRAARGVAPDQVEVELAGVRRHLDVLLVGDDRELADVAARRTGERPVAVAEEIARRVGQVAARVDRRRQHGNLDLDLILPGQVDLQVLWILFVGLDIDVGVEILGDRRIGERQRPGVDLNGLGLAAGRGDRGGERCQGWHGHPGQIAPGILEGNVERGPVRAALRVQAYLEFDTVGNRDCR
jgi:hypothetical protein